MEISGIGNGIISAYTDLTKTTDTQADFEKIFSEAIAKEDDEELQDACEQFEAYYVQQLFKEMRKTVPDGGLFESSNEQQIYKDMLDEEYSSLISKSRGVGIADALYKQLSPKFMAPQSTESELVSESELISKPELTSDAKKLSDGE